jgi:hypothetical protein
MQNWRGAGMQVQKALEQRWYQAEFKNLRNAELKEFQHKVQGALEESKFLNKELNRGFWHEAVGGEVTKLDLNTEEGRLQQVQLRGQLQADLIQRVGEFQIELGNVAAEKYRTNPLINKMISDLYKHTSNSLMAQFNPAAALRTAESMSGLRKDEAAIRASDAAARASDAQAQATRTKTPEGLHEAYQQGGAQGLDAFINGTDQGLALWAQVAPTYEKEVHEEFARNWRRTKGKHVTKNADLKMEADRDNQADRLRRIMQYRWVKSTLGEEVANELQKHNPGYGPDKVQPPDPAVKGAIAPKEIEAKSKKWAGIALDRYAEWMSEQPPETTMEDGVNWIMSQWLPEMMSGNVPEYEEHGEYIAENLTAGTTAATAEYRAMVREKVREHLLKNAGKGKGGKGLKPHQKAGGKGHPRRGGLGRAVRGLFDEDVYAEKAPPLPPEPEI